MYPYTIQDLGVLPGGDYTYPHAINNHGVIIGLGNSASKELAFRWTHGSGVNALPFIPGADLSTAYDINDHGEIAGCCAIHNVGGYSTYATHWKSGIVYNINPGVESVARAINNNGDIAGILYGGGITACTWIGGANKLLAHDIHHGKTTNESDVVSILDNGEVYGSCMYPAPLLYPYQTATKWDVAGNVNDLDYPDNLDKIGMRGRDSGVKAANNAGVAVGSTYDFSVLQPYFWNSAGKGLLGLLPGSLQGEAYDINTIGQVVGWLDNGIGHRAILWTGPIVTDLNDLIDPLSGWILIEANCLNDLGQIAGFGLLNGVRRAFLMQPMLTIRVVHFPLIFWHIIYGIVCDQPGIILGPHGPEPGPDPGPIESLLRHIPEILRPDLKKMLDNQQVQKTRGFRNK